MLSIGCCLLAIVYWLLSIGYCLLAIEERLEFSCGHTKKKEDRREAHTAATMRARQSPAPARALLPARGTAWF
jgi:hypothetical protein